MEFVINNNYGNLIYALYRKNILEESKFEFFINEIPFFLKIIEHGNWKVIPDIGLFKKASKESYLNAKWEIEGGKLSERFSFKTFAIQTRYHLKAFTDVSSEIRKLSKINSFQKFLLQSLILRNFLKHLWLQAIWKYKKSR